MHSLRSSIRARESGAAARPLSLDERRREAPADEAVALPKGERRMGDRRRHERHHSIVEKAAILYRGKRGIVAVANVSEGGITLDTSLVFDIGETLLIELAGQPPAQAKVRWVKKGRIGLTID
jgi:hypothetical protein